MSVALFCSTEWAECCASKLTALTVMVSETAANAGARQIVITDSQISPLATFSDLCFVVKEAQVDAFRSQSATLCLVQSLVVALAYRLGDGSNERGHSVG